MERMNSLNDIPIEVVAVDPPVDAGAGYAAAILREVETSLAMLVENGKASRIDLSSLPMGPRDFEQLREALGPGEVSATIDALGPTQVRETVVHGVWWITHMNVDGTKVAEFLDITYVPEILKSHPDDARTALARLRSHLNEQPS
jgi:hydrogenase-1 operon protein HyaF